LRQARWKYIEPGQGAKLLANTNMETGSDPGGQLYNLADDPGETKNLASEQPNRAKEMSAQLQKLRAQGRSR
jgi:arylsulfatase A-like enzyme